MDKMPRNLWVAGIAALALTGCGTTNTQSATVASAPTQPAAAAAAPSAVSAANCQFVNGKWVTNDSAYSTTPCVPDPAFATGDVQSDESGVVPRCHHCKLSDWTRAEEQARQSAATSTAAAPPTPAQTTAPAPSPLQQVASGQAAGDYAVAQTSGTVSSPSTIELHLSADPPQGATVSWTMICQETGGGVGSKSGQASLQLPTRKALPLPAPSDSCDVSANAQLSGSGTLHIAIYG